MGKNKKKMAEVQPPAMKKGPASSGEWKIPTERYEIDKMIRYVGEKKLKVKKHPSKELYIWNYTEKVERDGTCWDEITMNCRALVTDGQGNVVARCFSKFFNWQQGYHTPTDDFEVFQKVDGSLGMLFYYENQWMLATRGSFDSPQGRKAWEMLEIKKGVMDLLPKDKSHVFEIVYPENRLVVDYGDKEELVYLTSFYKNGVEEPETELMRSNGFDIVKRVEHNGDLRILLELDLEGQEGYVVRFANGERVKVKFPSYCRKHLQWFKAGNNAFSKAERVMKKREQ